MINRCERTIKMHYDYLVVGAGLYGAVFALSKDVVNFEFNAAAHDFIVPYITDLK